MAVDIDMGMTQAPGAPAKAACLDLEELLATRLLVQGNSGSGKSHLLRRLLEQSAAHVQQVVIDPEGDFVGLGDRHGHVVVDADRSIADLETIARRIRRHRISAILNLEGLEAEMQMRATGAFLNALFEADREHWYPMLVVVDEAQLFAPAVSGDVSEEARKLSLGAMTNLMCRGRKRGLAGIIATQRLAKLAKNVAAEASNFLMGRTFLDIDMARAADLLGMDRRQAETFRDLERGQFVALGPAISRRPLSVRVGPVETAARAGTPTLTPLPEQGPDDARTLILAPMPAAPQRPAREKRAAPPPSTTEILERLVRDRPVQDEPEEPSIPPQGRDGAFHGIAADILREAGAAFRPEGVLYQDFQTRCRMARIGGPPASMADFRLHLNSARAGVDADAPEWSRALALARDVPSDLQAIYLILAGAALSRVACPSDAEIARRCGMHSSGRARSQVRHLEKAGLVVIGIGLRGTRIVTLPELGWESLAGDPGGPPSPPGDDDRLIAAE